MDHELSNAVTNAFKRPLLKNIRSFEIRSKISKFSSFLIRRVKKMKISKFYFQVQNCIES